MRRQADRRSSGLAVLAMLLLWGCGAMSHGSGGPQAAVPSPHESGASPETDMHMTPGASPDMDMHMMTPAPVERIPFAFPPGPEAQLFVYDIALHDVYPYPGAGRGVQNVFELAQGQYYFDRGGAIFIYDHRREELVKAFDGPTFGLFAFLPFYDDFGNAFFLATRDPALAAAGLGNLYAIYAPRDETGGMAAGHEGMSQGHEGMATGSMAGMSQGHEGMDTGSMEGMSQGHEGMATGSMGGMSQGHEGMAMGSEAALRPEMGSLWSLSVVNAFAERHGAISSFALTMDDEVFVFTTGDGGLYLYFPRIKSVQQPPKLLEFGVGHAAMAYIDPIWGRWIVWQDTARRTIYLYDRWIDAVDPLPYANLAANAVETAFPVFLGMDPYHIFYLATLPGDPVPRMFAYDLRNQTVQTLAVLNALP